MPDVPQESRVQLCPVVMHNDRRCGRPIHNAPSSVDVIPVCLMHSRDPKKDDVAFQAEFHRTLNNPVEGDADFSRFIFLCADYRSKQFAVRCDFFEATFTQEAVFARATFAQAVDFRHAIFTRYTNFRRTTFEDLASFDWAVFRETADFSGVVFTQAADFNRTTFGEFASFQEAKFLGRVEFRHTAFREDSESSPGPVFSLAHFDKPESVIFFQTYLGQALLHNCDVSKIKFSDVRWRRRQPGNAKYLVFEEDVYLGVAGALALHPGQSNPDRRNYVMIAELYQQLKKNYDDRRDYWTAGDFHYGEMEMKRLALKPASRVLVTLVPTMVRRWLHQNLGLVAWYRYSSAYGESYVRPIVWLLIVLGVFTLAYPVVGLNAGKSQSSPASDVRNKSEEVVESKPSTPNATMKLNESRKVGKPHRQKSALSAVGAVPSRSGDPAKPTRQNSDKGQKRGSAVEVSELSYGRFFEYVRAHPNREWFGVTSFFGHSLMSAIYVAAFQKDLVYEPSYPWGRLIAFMELLLTSALVALFLLAVRRQFRR